MFGLGWQTQEKMVKDYMNNHAKDFGRFFCEIMIESPKTYMMFMEGFYEEFERRKTIVTGDNSDDAEV